MLRLSRNLKIMLAVLGPLVVSSVAQAHDWRCRALHEAVFMDEPQEVLALIKRGVDVNCLDQLRHTPIITATTGASMESFLVLLRNGAKINVKDEWGMTLIARIQDQLRKYQEMQGAETYRRIYRRMADLVAQGDPVN